RQRTLALGARLFPQARRRDQQLHRGFPAAQYPGGHAQILELGPCARSDISKVNGKTLELIDRPAIGRTVRRGDLRRQLPGIETVVSEEARISIAVPDFNF